MPATYDFRGLFAELEALALTSPAIARRILDTIGHDWEAACPPDLFWGAVLARQAADIAAGAEVYREAADV